MSNTKLNLFKKRRLRNRNKIKRAINKRIRMSVHRSSKNILEAWTLINLEPSLLEKIVLISSASPPLSSPWSTKTHTSWSPIALSKIAAVTD